MANASSRLAAVMANPWSTFTERGAIDLCGLDLSSAQIANAAALCRERGFEPELPRAPMESDPGIAHQTYDIALSLYALGWSVDLDAALAHIARYLRPGGILVFSWEHPVFRCLKSKHKELILESSYSVEGPIESMSWNGGPIVMHARKLSTFLNAIIGCGLRIEKVIKADLHEGDGGLRDYPRRWSRKDRRLHAHDTHYQSEQTVSPSRLQFPWRPRPAGSRARAGAFKPCTPRS